MHGHIQQPNPAKLFQDAQVVHVPLILCCAVLCCAMPAVLCRFYQYLATGAKWDWGLMWGHVVSRDLVTWEHMPPALAPTPGGVDGDGCFSGCAAIDHDGTPVLLYTGVRLRHGASAGPAPPPECDLGLPSIEIQAIARAVPGECDEGVWWCWLRGSSSSHIQQSCVQSACKTLTNGAQQVGKHACPAVTLHTSTNTDTVRT